MNGARRTLGGTSLRRGRVLVIDGESRAGQKLAEGLVEHDILLVQAGADAFAVIAVGCLYNLILCDVVLPDMTGVELLERVGHDKPAQASRLVFMADARVLPVVESLLDSVSNLCIVPPYDIGGLRALIERRTRLSHGSDPHME